MCGCDDLISHVGNFIKFILNKQPTYNVESFYRVVLESILVNVWKINTIESAALLKKYQFDQYWLS